MITFIFFIPKTMVYMYIYSIYVSEMYIGGVYLCRNVLRAKSPGGFGGREPPKKKISRYF